MSPAFFHQTVCFDIPMAAYRYAGAGSTVEFDDVAGTVTFEHTHWRQPRNKRAASPWIVPVGAIEGISWREATASKPGEMRLLLRGRKGHNRDGRADFNYITGKDKIGALVAALNAAVQTAEPILGFGDDLTPQRAPAPAAVSVNVPVDPAVGPPPPEKAVFGGFKLDGKILTYKGQRYRVAGIRATVEIGGTQQRTTLTRMALGTAINPGAGTMIGAMAKKQTHNLYLTIEFPSGTEIMVEVPGNAELLARSFASALNSASRAAES